MANELWNPQLKLPATLGLGDHCSLFDEQVGATKIEHTAVDLMQSGGLSPFSVFSNSGILLDANSLNAGNQGSVITEVGAAGKLSVEFDEDFDWALSADGWHWDNLPVLLSDHLTLYGVYEDIASYSKFSIIVTEDAGSLMFSMAGSYGPSHSFFIGDDLGTGFSIQDNTIGTARLLLADFGAQAYPALTMYAYTDQGITEWSNTLKCGTDAILSGESNGVVKSCNIKAPLNLYDQNSGTPGTPGSVSSWLKIKLEGNYRYIPIYA